MDILYVFVCDKPEGSYGAWKQEGRVDVEASCCVVDAVDCES